jgi:hypothetical protein
MRMKKLRCLNKNNSGAASILEAMIAIGVSIIILSVFFISVVNLYVVYDRPEKDLEAKGVGAIEKLMTSPTQGEAGSLESVSISSSETVAYGIVYINETGTVIPIGEQYDFVHGDIGVVDTCFLGDTHILMADGSYKDIEDLEIGDFVKSYDEITCKIIKGLVTDVFSYAREEMKSDHYLVVNNELKLTPDHRVYSNGEWIIAGDLKVGDSLFNPTCKYPIFSIEKIFEKQPVYNLEVEKYHNYFVAMGNGNILVHNGGTQQIGILPYANAGPTIDSMRQGHPIRYDATVGEPFTPDASDSFPKADDIFSDGTYKIDKYYWDFDCDPANGDNPVFIDQFSSESPNGMSNIYDDADTYIIALKVVDGSGNIFNIDLTTVSFAGFSPQMPWDPLKAKCTWFDEDGLGSGITIFCDASKSDIEDRFTNTYEWDVGNDGTTDYITIDEPTISINLNKHQISKLSDGCYDIRLTMIDGMNRIDFTVIRVKPNTDQPPDLVPTTPIPIYPGTEQTTVPYGEKYYVTYKNLSARLGKYYYLYEIKEKKLKPYEIVDLGQFEKLYKKNYEEIKSALGISNSASQVLNLHITLLNENKRVVAEYGAGFEEESSYTNIKAVSRDIVIYHPPDVKTLNYIEEPYYEKGLLVVRFFIGGIIPPPNTPIVYLPSEWLVNRPAEFTINLDDYVADPDNEPYQIDWSTYPPHGVQRFQGDISFDAVTETRKVTVHIPINFPNEGVTATFTATDPQGHTGTKDVLFYPPINHPPNEPSYIYPGCGDTDVPRTPTLRWICSDPDGDSLSYELYLFSSSGGTPPTPIELQQSQYTPAPLDYKKQYTWYIIAEDEHGLTTTGPTCSFTTVEEPWLHGWSFRKVIQIDQGYIDITDEPSGRLVNFPVLISITDSGLRDNAQSDGDDIVFTDVDGKTVLDHEIEVYKSATGTLETWVKIPELGTDMDPPDPKTIYMYYGNPNCDSQQNPNGVWSNGYVGVWHLNEAGTGIRKDSTNNKCNGIPKWYEGDEKVNGVVGYADNLDGTPAQGDNIEISSDKLNLWQRLTIEGWMKPTVDKNGILMSRTDKPFTVYQYGFAYCPTTPLIQPLSLSYAKTKWANWTNQLLTLNQWHYVAVTVNGLDAYAYKSNPDFVTLPSKVLDNSINPTPGLFNKIGARYKGGGAGVDSTAYEFAGIIDEVRVSEVARSQGWLHTTFNTIHYKNSGFIASIGAQESPQTNQPPYIGNEIPNDKSSDVSVSTNNIMAFIFDQNTNDNFDWTITTNPNIGQSSGSSPYTGGLMICAVSNLQHATTYTWTVTATDNNGNENIQTFTFTTQP